MINSEILRQIVCDAKLLRLYWENSIDEFLPTTSQFVRWIVEYSTPVVEFGIKRTATKACVQLSLAKPMSLDYMVRYASGCMSNKRKETMVAVVQP